MHKNIIKTFLSDIFIAITAIMLYSPGLLALRPTDSSIFKAGMSIICGVILSYAAIKVNFGGHAVKAISVENVNTLSDCRLAIQELSGYKTFKSVISNIVLQIERAEQYRTNMANVIGMRFAEGSMSYDKFAVIVDQAIGAIIVNTRSLITRVQMFNETDYLSNHMAVKSGTYLKDDIPDDIQMEKEKLYQETISSIKSIVGLNESILLRLEELNIELTSMDSQVIDFDNNQIVSDIKNLITDTKLYSGGN